LKSTISYHMSRSNSAYSSSSYVDRYILTSASKARIKQAVYHLRLFRAAVNRYVELKGSLKGLPKFASTPTFKVNINVDVETAYEILKDYCE